MFSTTLHYFLFFLTLVTIGLGSKSRICCIFPRLRGPVYGPSNDVNDSVRRTFPLVCGALYYYEIVLAQ